MKSKNNNPRRDFIKKSVFAAAGMSIIPGFVLGKDGNITSITEQLSRALAGQDGIKKVAFITHIYRNSAHADVIGTKLFLGIPTDDGMVAPQIKIVSVYIEQVGANDTGIKIAAMNDTPVYPTLEEALTLGGDKLAVDAVIYVGEHGEYPYNRLGMKLYPRMNYLERIFRVFDASNKSVPVFTDKALSYSWLDSKWIYDRAKELNVSLMAGSSLPYCWRDKPLEHPIGVKIREAVAIGYASLDAYGFHVTEILQCMVERRAGGETGVESVEGLKGNDVWAAIDSGRISQKLVDAACDTIQGKATGNMREIVKMPYAVIVKYKDGTKGSIVMLDQYVNQGWAYAANTGKNILATEFVLDHSMSYSHFSYLSLNIQKFIVSGKPTAPIERNLLTSGIIDMGIRSLAEGKVRETPFLDIKYSAIGFEPIRPTAPRPTGQSIGPWPPKGYEFIIPDAFKNKK
ncbi:hypothetical protein SAMN05421813_11356 [Daejeonella rubra]|uniref:Uncharacterized protein n=1 Tax=Daejeonella rubra TaxID=990371 RepID=A0A1G9TKQ4_9SPHI|nr:hypothetical protein [Daejeonella rubra]SDM48138.1 hypothetical protein SAMN05421813_11356 [Daejeonella rubra]